MTPRRRSFLTAIFSALFASSARGESPRPSSAIIDDLSAPPPQASIGSEWRLFTDAVMGGVSRGTMTRETVAGRTAIRLRGKVSLENNGGFVQMALDLLPDGAPIDASQWRGVEIDVYGNDEDYALNLRTSDLTRPWQSYRQTFRAAQRWETVRLPFESFVPSRTETPLNTRRLRRLGVIGIGRQFDADVAIGGVKFFR